MANFSNRSISKVNEFVVENMTSFDVIVEPDSGCDKRGGACVLMSAEIFQQALIYFK